MSKPIVFIDRDGTISPELPALRIARDFFHDAAFGLPPKAPNPFLRRLVRRGAVLVWNSRNPETAVRPRGRLHSFNQRRFPDATAEHKRLLEAAGIPENWFNPGHPEVVHCNGGNKSEGVVAYCRRLGIPLEMTVTFENETDQMRGAYPFERVILVDSLRGIDKEGFDRAESLLRQWLAPKATL